MEAELRKHPSKRCPGCGVSLANETEPSYGFVYHHMQRGRPIVDMTQCCSQCQDMEIAIAEANDESRRFTCIGVGDDSSVFHTGPRCVCGASTHAMLGMCVSCWRRNRMLDKAAAESRLLSKILKELRSTIKDKKKRETEDQPH